jgi:phage baseplate assembly protein gpV
LLASQGNEYAFLDAATTEIDQVAKSVGDALSRQLFRASSASIGRVNNSSFAVTTLDLVTDTDALNFEVNQKIVTSATLSGGSVRSGSLTVSAVDRDATSNQVTTSANLSTGISAIAQNDYIYIEGNYDNGVSGLADWVPAVCTRINCILRTGS